MSNSFVAIRVPITMKIGPVPDDVNTTQAKIRFGLANINHILTERGIQATIDGEYALATFADGEEPAETVTVNGMRSIDKRAFRVQPDGEKHSLELSTDLGQQFAPAGSFVDYDFANSIGEAWADGRIA